MSKLYRYPQDFLRQSAIAHNLSDPESDIFYLRFVSGLENAQIMKELKLNQAALHKRFGGIYQKYRIQRRGKGKDNDLLKILDKEFQSFKSDRTYRKEVSGFGKERENDSIEHELRKLWQELNRLQRDSDRASTTNSFSENLNRSGDVYTWIDSYIEMLQESNSPTNRVLNEFAIQISPLVEEIAINSTLKDREIAVLLLKYCKIFAKRILSPKGVESNNTGAYSTENSVINEEAIDPVQRLF